MHGCRPGAEGCKGAEGCSAWGEAAVTVAVTVATS